MLWPGILQCKNSAFGFLFLYYKDTVVYYGYKYKQAWGKRGDGGSFCSSFLPFLFFAHLLCFPLDSALEYGRCDFHLFHTHPFLLSLSRGVLEIPSCSQKKIAEWLISHPISSG
jgi:hypothetical protein